MRGDNNFAADWKLFNFAVVDLEGTGAQHRELEGIVDICVVPIIRGSISGPTFRALLDPEIDIPAIVSRIHGIKNSDVVGRPKLDDVRAEVIDALVGKILVAHNASIERRVFGYRFPEISTVNMIDTLKLAKFALPTLSKYGLDDLIDYFDLQNYVKKLSAVSGRHSALLDAQVTAVIFTQLLDEFFPAHCSLSELLRISEGQVTPGQESLF